MVWARSSILELVLVVLCLVLAFQAEGFFTVVNLLNVLRNVSMPGIIAFGMTMVIISGEIDLSVGSAVAFAGCVTAWLAQWLAAMGLSMVVALPLAMFSTLLLGMSIGALTGLIRVRFAVPSFIITLAWMTVLTGVAELITGGFPLTPFPEWYNFFGGGYLFGVPFPALVFLLVFLTTHVLMGYTSFGRSVYAVGGNPEAARLSGIRVGRVKVLVMASVALPGGLGGDHAVGPDHVRVRDHGPGLGTGRHRFGHHRRHQPHGRRREDPGHPDGRHLPGHPGQRHDVDEHQRVLAARGPGRPHPGRGPHQPDQRAVSGLKTGELVRVPTRYRLRLNLTENHGQEMRAQIPRKGLGNPVSIVRLGLYIVIQ